MSHLWLVAILVSDVGDGYGDTFRRSPGEGALDDIGNHWRVAAEVAWGTLRLRSDAIVGFVAGIKKFSRSLTS